MEVIAHPFVNLGLLLISCLQLASLARRALKGGGAMRIQRLLQAAVFVCLLAHIAHEYLLVREFYASETLGKQASPGLVAGQYLNEQVLQTLSVLSLLVFVYSLYPLRAAGRRETALAQSSVYGYAAARLVPAAALWLGFARDAPLAPAAMDVLLAGEAVVLGIVFCCLGLQVRDVQGRLEESLVPERFFVEKMVGRLGGISRGFGACFAIESGYRVALIAAAVYPASARTAAVADACSVLRVIHHALIFQTLKQIALVENDADDGIASKISRGGGALPGGTFRFFEFTPREQRARDDGLLHDQLEITP